MNWEMIAETLQRGDRRTETGLLYSGVGINVDTWHPEHHRIIGLVSVTNQLKLCVILRGKMLECVPCLQTGKWMAFLAYIRHIHCVHIPVVIDITGLVLPLSSPTSNPSQCRHNELQLSVPTLSHNNCLTTLVRSSVSRALYYSIVSALYLL